LNLRLVAPHKSVTDETRAAAHFACAQEKIRSARLDLDLRVFCMQFQKKFFPCARTELEVELVKRFLSQYRRFRL
jgi:hypothetical protein